MKTARGSSLSLLTVSPPSPNNLGGREQQQPLENPITLDDLPPELLYEMIRAVPDLSAHDLLMIALVSVRFCGLAQSPTAWRSLASMRWGTDVTVKVPKTFDWKLYHREKCAFDRPFLWTPFDDIEPHPPPRQSHGAAKVGNKLVIMGGHQIVDERFQRQDDIWTFDTTTKVFERLLIESSLPAVSRHRMVTLDNKIYSFGGILQDKKKLNSIFKFDPSTLQWEELSVKGQIPEPRCDSVVVAHGRKLVVFGGSVQDLVFPSDLHVFDVDTQQWTKPPVLGEVPPARIGCTGAVVGDVMYLYGGGDYDKDQQKYKALFTEVWALDLVKFQWSRVSTVGEVPTISDFLNVFVIGNHLVIEGGWYSEPYAFDTVGKRWRRLTTTTVDGSKVNNNDASATLIGNDVYYYGGYYNAYKHHLYKMDVSSLSFLLGGE